MAIGLLARMAMISFAGVNLDKTLHLFLLLHDRVVFIQDVYGFSGVRHVNLGDGHIVLEFIFLYYFRLK